MAYAIQPIGRNILPYQRSLNNPAQQSFKQWLGETAPENDSASVGDFASYNRPKTSLEDLLLLAQEDAGTANTVFTAHAPQNPYEALALPSDIETDGQYTFEFLTAAAPAVGEKINREI